MLKHEAIKLIDDMVMNTDIPIDEIAPIVLDILLKVGFKAPDSKRQDEKGEIVIFNEFDDEEIDGYELVEDNE